MWLVLCTASDESARWAHAGLREGSAAVELVTDLDLVGARWEHRLDATTAWTVVSLADGRVLDSREVRGALNRFLAIPPAMLAAVAPQDREYAAGELWALLVSWLAALPGPVLNPATARGLSGAWRQRSEWSLLAARAGLPAASAWIHSGDGVDDPPTSTLKGWSDWPPFAPLPEDVIVLGDAVFSRDRLTPALRRACRALADLAGTPILGLRFRVGRSTHSRASLVSVTSLPDLRAGGPSIVDALAEAIGMRAAS
jgi:hypothetical protein